MAGRLATDLSCEAAILREQLKHSWIENEIRSKSEEEVVFLWREPRWPTLEDVFPSRVHEAEHLAGHLEEGFSPAQLVARLTPLARLPGDIRNRIETAVHAVYLERSDIAALKQPLTEAVAAVRQALDRFLVVWKQPVSDQAERRLRESWRQFHDSALRLRLELDRLPRGIVLP